LKESQTAKQRDNSKKEPAFISYRYFLQDAVFVVGLSGNELLLENIVTALKNPVFPIGLGRRACVPELPIILKSISPADGVPTNSTVDAIAPVNTTLVTTSTAAASTVPIVSAPISPDSSQVNATITQDCDSKTVTENIFDNVLRDVDLETALKQEPWQAKEWYRRKKIRSMQEGEKLTLELMIDCEADDPERILISDFPISYSPIYRKYGQRFVRDAVNGVEVDISHLRDSIPEFFANDSGSGINRDSQITLSENVRNLKLSVESESGLVDSESDLGADFDDIIEGRKIIGKGEQ
jgi:hypothetical protein